ncbi:biotin--[acetyl-CoA-carboxylase] ligase [Echinicola jeungdonensis]|uniref:Biotin--[acetyl-CoA-carboxylase] ligase n=1 Tax=Echinicola jeungdonensis TaxID=709343 RepID=A0ABV5JBL7_9BACT|nr:biotin--[acetyl-CoA-carboxylase] ligase [Echinicola jeungdonensis]MDN3670186.1 biotin--[acetyl-CoA-carboxylase] ligase [Echinicola jeungdonensis]
MHKILANTVFLGKDVKYLTECHSTNDMAAQEYKNGHLIEGSIIITDKQTKGRGQRGNRWYSEPGKNLTFSLVLTPCFLDVSQQFDLNRAISLAVHAALEDYVKGIKVKWPNDIVYENGEKIGGILIENTLGQRGMEHSIVGIGLNINQIDFPFPGPVSMAILTGGELDRDELFKSIIHHIEKEYTLLKKGKLKGLRQSFNQHLYRMDQWASYQEPGGKQFEAKIVDVNAEGKLLLKKQGGEIKHYTFKEVQFL